MSKQEQQEQAQQYGDSVSQHHDLEHDLEHVDYKSLCLSKKRKHQDVLFNPQSEVLPSPKKQKTETKVETSTTSTVSTASTSLITPAQGPEQADDVKKQATLFEDFLNQFPRSTTSNEVASVASEKENSSPANTNNNTQHECDWLPKIKYPVLPPVGLSTHGVLCGKPAGTGTKTGTSIASKNIEREMLGHKLKDYCEMKLGSGYFIPWRGKVQKVQKIEKIEKMPKIQKEQKKEQKEQARVQVKAQNNFTTFTTFSTLENLSYADVPTIPYSANPLAYDPETQPVWTKEDMKVARQELRDEWKEFLDYARTEEGQTRRRRRARFHWVSDECEKRLVFHPMKPQFATEHQLGTPLLERTSQEREDFYASMHRCKKLLLSLMNLTASSFVSRRVTLVETLLSLLCLSNAGALKEQEQAQAQAREQKQEQEQEQGNIINLILEYDDTNHKDFLESLAPQAHCRPLKLQQLNPMPQDKHIRFRGEHLHRYYIEGLMGYTVPMCEMSVTSRASVPEALASSAPLVPSVPPVNKITVTSTTPTVHSYFPHFETEEAINLLRTGRNYIPGSMYWNMSRAQIKQAWKDNGEEKGKQGSEFHNKIEKAINNEPHGPVTPRFTYFITWSKERIHQRGWAWHRAEELLFDLPAMLAGAVDISCYIDPIRNWYKLAVGDWKTWGWFTFFNDSKQGCVPLMPNLTDLFPAHEDHKNHETPHDGHHDRHHDGHHDGHHQETFRDYHNEQSDTHYKCHNDHNKHHSARHDSHDTQDSAWIRNEMRYLPAALKRILYAHVEIFNKNLLSRFSDKQCMIDDTKVAQAFLQINMYSFLKEKTCPGFKVEYQFIVVFNDTFDSWIEIEVPNLRLLVVHLYFRRLVQVQKALNEEAMQTQHTFSPHAIQNAKQNAKQIAKQHANQPVLHSHTQSKQQHNLQQRVNISSIFTEKWR